MRKRIFLSLFLTLLISSILIASIGILITYNEYLSRLIEDLNIEINYLSQIELNRNTMDALSINGRRITLIDRSGNVLFDSMKDKDGLENHLDRSEVQEAINKGSGFATRSSSSVGEKYIYKAIALKDGNVLRLSTPANTITHFLLSIFWPFLICLALLSVVSFFISSYLAKRIIKPINDMPLDNPNSCDIYPELTPLLVKISKQQDIIHSQIEEERKRQSEFMLITDNMQEGLVVISRDGTILALNSAIKRLYNNQALKPGDSILTISRTLDFSSAVKRALDGERVEMKIEQGGRILALIVNPVFDYSEVAGAVLLFLDVTEKDKREEMRREFTANVSHELKTPLTVILGFAEMLKADNLDKENIKEFSNEIYNQAKRISDLVHDTIRLSELDEGGKELKKEPVALLPIAEKAVETLDKKIKERGIEVEFDHSEDTTLVGNEFLLFEMVYNLLDNAIRYNKENGKIRIKIEKDSDSLLLDISDSGIGIPDKDIDRVFERFYRVDKARSRDSGGTGLGLSIVKHVASFHNADIQAESQLGVGTKIKIQFPFD